MTSSIYIEVYDTAKLIFSIKSWWTEVLQKLCELTEGNDDAFFPILTAAENTPHGCYLSHTTIYSYLPSTPLPNGQLLGAVWIGTIQKQHPHIC